MPTYIASPTTHTLPRFPTHASFPMSNKAAIATCLHERRQCLTFLSDNASSDSKRHSHSTSVTQRKYFTFSASFKAASLSSSHQKTIIIASIFKAGLWTTSVQHCWSTLEIYSSGPYLKPIYKGRKCSSYNNVHQSVHDRSNELGRR